MNNLDIWIEAFAEQYPFIMQMNWLALLCYLFLVLFFTGLSLVLPFIILRMHSNIKKILRTLQDINEKLDH